MKNKVRLTESQLEGIIKESVKNVLKEMQNEGFRDSFASAYNKEYDPVHYVGHEYVNGDYDNDNENKFGRFKNAMGYRLGASAKNIKQGKFSKINPFKNY